MIVYLWYATDVGGTVLTVCGGPTLSFHLFWFWKWQKGYRQKLEGGAAKEAKLEASSSIISSSSASASASHAPTSSSVSSLSSTGVALLAAIGGGDLEVGSEAKGAPEPKIHPPPEVKVGSPLGEKAEGGGRLVRLPPPPVRNKERQA